MNVSDFTVNMRVNYQEIEDGTVSSVNGYFVFVKFDEQVAKLGWNNTTAKACYPNTLKVISNGR